MRGLLARREGRMSRRFLEIAPRAGSGSPWYWWRSTRPGGRQWGSQPIIGLDSTVELTAIGVSLPFSEIYDGIDLDEA